MIRLEHPLFSYGGKPILEEADLSIAEGARVGILGPNGSGKTTLFRLLLGELALEAGKIVIPRQRRMVFLPQYPLLPQAETILQHVMASQPTLRDLEDGILRVEQKMAAETDPSRLDRLVERHRLLSREFEAAGGYDLEARVAGTLTGLGFSRGDLLREIGPLSPGEKNRVALAKVLLSEADILLLDEPTNHLDFRMLEWLEELLRNPPRGVSQVKVTVLLVSHDRYFLNRCVDEIVELRGGKLYPYRGNYDDFARQRAEEIARQEKEYHLQQVEISKELEFIRRNFAAQKARQAKSREKKLDRMEIVDAPEHHDPTPRIRFDTTSRAGDDVLRTRDLDCGYAGEGTERLLVSGVNLELRRGERLAILGPNGCGKTTLLRSLVGHLPPLRGTIHLGQRTVLGYYEQELSGQGSDKTVFDEIHDLVPLWTDQAVRDLLASFLFRGDEIFLKTRSLSGGEKARVALVRLILSGANLLVLDEPTNHLDVYARAALEESLLEFPETVLFVSHDRYFVERVATRVLAVVDGTLREYIGGYETYRAEGAQAATTEMERDASRKGKKAASRADPRAATREAEERRIMSAISTTEERIRTKQEECGVEQHYRNPEIMRRLKRELSELQGQLDELYRKWESLGT